MNELFAVFMSSIRPAASSPNFQSIINALADYADLTGLTGIDLTKNPFENGEKIKLSNSPEAILELLQEREKAFKDYREVNQSKLSQPSREGPTCLFGDC
jgi:hypothetical protein